MTKLIALFLTVLPMPAMASDFCALAKDMEARIAERLGYAPSEGCPAIGFALPAGEEVQRSQAGAYHPASGRIDLSPDLDMTTAYGQSFLLHELVHAAQYRAGRDRLVPCPAALEAEAYGEQADFLMEAGKSREAVLTRALGAQLGVCEALPY